MAIGHWDYTVVMGPEWQAVVEALRVMDDNIPEQVLVKIREVAEPVILDVQAAALRIPAYTNQHTGVRMRLAKGVGVHVSSPRGIRITTSMDEQDELALPRGFDNGPAGWRHPVFGNRDVWVRQRGYSWFLETISEDQDQFVDAAEEVLEEAVAMVAAAGSLP